MRLIAKADLPNGVKSGEALELNSYQGSILLGLGVVRLADEAAPKPVSDKAPDTHDDDDKVEKDVDAPAPPPMARRAPTTYRRRDLTAEDALTDKSVE